MKSKINTLDEDVEPYERQSYEEDKAWAAFVAYRDLGPAKRSHSATVEALGRPSTYIGQTRKLSSTNTWRQRVIAWDKHQDKIERDKMKIRHLSISKSLQAIGMAGIKGLSDKIKEAKDGANLFDVLNLPPQEIRKYIDDGQKLERLNMGEPGEIKEERNIHSIDDTVRREVDDMIDRAKTKK